MVEMTTYVCGGWKLLKISELQTKDVININDGRNLGAVCDLEIDLRRGRVEAIVCPGQGKFFGLFSSGDEIVIPWNHIIKIGSDVILVRLDEAIYSIEGKPRSHKEDSGQIYKPYTHQDD